MRPSPDLPRPMTPTLVRPVKLRRALGAAFTACLVAVLAACPGEINGRVDRIGGPVSGGGSGGGGPISGGGGGDTTVATHDPFAAIVAGNGISCGLTERGVAYCWGANGIGQLGVGDTVDRYIPTQVASPLVFRRLYAEESTVCGIAETGDGYCWGLNFAGTLGTGDTLTRRVPTRIVGTQTWLHLSPSWTHTCGVDDNATAWCWGYNEQAGQLGDSTKINRREPVQVKTSFAFAEVHPAETHTCGRRTDGVIMCWGSNVFNTRLGRSGPGTLAPQAIESSQTFSTMAAIKEATCAIESAAPRVQCWGDPDLIGSATGDGVVPKRIDLEEDVASLSMGGETACILNVLGRMWCWGSNNSGQFVNGTNRSSPTPVAAQTDLRFREIAVGQGHTCGIERVGSATWCWGSNTFGALGAGRSAPVYSYTPLRVR